MEYRGYVLENKKEIKQCAFGMLINRLCNNFINAKVDNNINRAVQISKKMSYILNKFKHNENFIQYTDEFLYEIQMFKYDLKLY